MPERIYAIGDVHGQLAMLEEALRRIEADGGTEAKVVLLGDYIDRGPESRAVLEALMEAQARGRPWVMLKGNHDAYLPQFIRDGEAFGSRTRPGLSWFDPILGGDKTMASYGVETGDRAIPDILAEARGKVPEAHCDFIDSLPLLHETEDLLFVHAGLRPGIAPADQDPLDLLWIREPFLSDKSDHGKLVVHGHTAVDRPEHCGNRINLDGGAGWNRPLLPAVFEGRDVWLLTETGRVPLLPPIS